MSVPTVITAGQSAAVAFMLKFYYMIGQPADAIAAVQNNFATTAFEAKAASSGAVAALLALINKRTQLVEVHVSIVSKSVI